MQVEMTDHPGYEKTRSSRQQQRQLTQWGDDQDAERRFWRDAFGDAAGLQRQLRTEDYR